MLGGARTAVAQAQPSLRPSPRTSRLLRLLRLSALAWTLLLAGDVCRLPAQPEQDADVSREYAIKAAYLYQFGR